MPTVVTGAPVASCIPPHENRAKPRVAPDEDPAESLRRVAPDENQAELLRRVAPDENQAKSLCTSLLIRIAAASPRCSARYENRVPPRPVRKTIPPSGLTGKNDTPETIPADFPRKYHRHGQTSNLPRGRSACKADRRKQPAKITQKNRGLCSYSTTPKPEKQRDGMQICNLFTQPAKPKGKVLMLRCAYCIYCLFN